MKGRPKTFKTRHDTYVSLDASHIAKLDELAQRYERSRSWIISHIVIAFLRGTVPNFGHSHEPNEQAA